jgi:hypothetical protein
MGCARKIFEEGDGDQWNRKLCRRSSGVARRSNLFCTLDREAESSLRPTGGQLEHVWHSLRGHRSGFKRQHSTGTSSRRTRRQQRQGTRGGRRNPVPQVHSRGSSAAPIVMPGPWVRTVRGPRTGSCGRHPRRPSSQCAEAWVAGTSPATNDWMNCLSKSEH